MGLGPPLLSAAVLSKRTNLIHPVRITNILIQSRPFESSPLVVIATRFVLGVQSGAGLNSDLE